VEFTDATAIDDAADFSERRMEMSLVADQKYDTALARRLHEVNRMIDIRHHRLLDEDVKPFV